MIKTNISLVKKNDSWVPKKEQQISAIEKHGYNLKKTLGEGAYAKVKLADSRKHNCCVAVKIINKRRAPKDFLQKFLPREVHLMHRLNHPNVIRLHEVVETSTKVYIVLQLASQGDLLEFINNNPVLSEDQVRIMFCQLAAAMAYCHKEHIVHWDLKCENILLVGEGKLKVTDFGFAISTVKNRLLETYCGSFAYCCPQIIRGEPYDGKKADVWSMGVVLYAMACARLPFSDEDMKALSRNEYHGKIKFSKRVSKECRDLVRSLLNPDQNERLTAEEAFRSPWCLKALYDNPSLSYLEDNLRPVSMRKPSECAPPETDKFEEESYPVEIKQLHPKLGQSPRLINCFTFPAKEQQPKQSRWDTSRRHTISGLPVLDSSYRMNLRDDLLRSLADKAVKSLHAIEEEKKELPIESYGRRHSRRSSTIVTDVLGSLTPTDNIAKDLSDKKTSLVADVIMKFDPKKRGSTASREMTRLPKHLKTGIVTRSLPQIQPGYVNAQRLKVENRSVPEKYLPLACLSRRIPGGRDSRFKEIQKLKFTSAARAAKMAFKEAQISMQANRRMSSVATDYYVTVQFHTINNTSRMQGSIEKDASANTKFFLWRKKFQEAGLNQDTLATIVASEKEEQQKS
ncbi:testis-specific serine/threonine-protein kinase 1-like [Montipora capricornis]|uniref:testis-specific serine/threonine-protein kinase 1-like n=1 Tax=Montipora capricornis TaxID=246305 RepID=UPI0035F13E87